MLLQSVYTYAEGAEWVREVAEALEYLHSGAGGSCQEVIHRDIKPANVMLSKGKVSSCYVIRRQCRFIYLDIKPANVMFAEVLIISLNQMSML